MTLLALSDNHRTVRVESHVRARLSYQICLATFWSWRQLHRRLSRHRRRGTTTTTTASSQSRRRFITIGSFVPRVSPLPPLPPRATTRITTVRDVVRHINTINEAEEEEEEEEEEQRKEEEEGDRVRVFVRTKQRLQSSWDDDYSFNGDKTLGVLGTSCSKNKNDNDGEKEIIITFTRNH